MEIFWNFQFTINVLDNHHHYITHYIMMMIWRIKNNYMFIIFLPDSKWLLSSINFFLFFISEIYMANTVNDRFCFFFRKEKDHFIWFFFCFDQMWMDYISFQWKNLKNYPRFFCSVQFSFQKLFSLVFYFDFVKKIKIFQGLAYDDDERKYKSWNFSKKKKD